MKSLLLRKTSRKGKSFSFSSPSTHSPILVCYNGLVFIVAFKMNSDIFSYIRYPKGQLILLLTVLVVELQHSFSVISRTLPVVYNFSV